MKRKSAYENSKKKQAFRWVRASISFPSEVYDALANTASQKRVSLAWVVRDATEKYLIELRSVPGKQQR